MIVARLLAAMLLSTAVVSSAGAQDLVDDVRVILRTPDGRSTAGALIAFVNGDGKVVSEAIARSDGQRVFRLNAGTYRIRVLRIGYRPYLSEPLVVNRSRPNPITIELATAKVLLANVLVRGKNECRIAGSDPEVIGVVWEEITKALRSSELTSRDLAEVSHAIVYRRETTTAGAVLSADTSLLPVGRTRPFATGDPSALVAKGYVTGDEYNGWEFFGPDERVLLSPEFAATHCFRLVRENSRPAEVGITVEPIPGRKRSDIAGTIWVDEQSSELRRIDFHFVNAGLPSRFDAGGFTRFIRTGSGVFIVDEWQLRMPRIEIRRGSAPTFGIEERQHVFSSGYIDVGGRFGRPTSRNDEVSIGRVTGVVYDSLSAQPLKGASVVIDGSSALSDSRGTFVIDSVRSGRRIVSFSHEAVTGLGVKSFEREIEISGSNDQLSLATPSMETAWRRICVDTPLPVNYARRTIVHGFVVDGTANPISGATIQFEWTVMASGPAPRNGVRVTAPVHLEVATGSDGHFAACGFEAGAKGSIALLIGGKIRRSELFRLETKRLIRQDFSY